MKAPAEEEVEKVDEIEPSGGSSGPEDFEVLEKEKLTAPNGNGKANKRNKKGRK